MNRDRDWMMAQASTALAHDPKALVVLDKLSARKATRSALHGNGGRHRGSEACSARCVGTATFPALWRKVDFILLENSPRRSSRNSGSLTARITNVT